MSSREQAKADARAAREAAEQDAATAAARTRRLQLLGGVLAAAVAIVVVVIVVSSSGGGGKKKAAPKTGLVQGVAAVTAEYKGIPQNGTTLGKASAPVTLVEFADLKCPVCQAYTLTVQPTIVAKYVRAGKVKIEFRAQHFVGNTNNDSEHAAQFALAVAKQNHFWDFASLFYVNQQDETTTYVTPAYLRRIASAVPGVNASAALAARSSAAITSRLKADTGEFDGAGFTGTPSFLLGRSSGTLSPVTVRSAPQLSAAIDKLL